MMKWERYRKRPIVIEAHGPIDHEIRINTLEGTMFASVGDYIIKGISGEMYPCKPGIFLSTYDKVE